MSTKSADLAGAVGVPGGLGTFAGRSRGIVGLATFAGRSRGILKLRALVRPLRAGRVASPPGLIIAVSALGFLGVLV